MKSSVSLIVVCLFLLSADAEITTLQVEDSSLSTIPPSKSTDVSPSSIGNQNSTTGTTALPDTTLSNTITPTTTTTRKPDSNPSVVCQNGGTFNGMVCVCPSDFVGTRCEFISDRIVVDVKSVSTTVRVQMKVINEDFTDDLTVETSSKYIEFEKKFKNEMKPVYSKVTGYQDLIILSLRPGSVIVNHDVIVMIEYNDVLINDQYDERVQLVKDQLELLNCTSGASPLCIDRTFTSVTAIPPPSEEALCTRRITPGFQGFFSPLFLENQLTCVSDCDSISPKYQSCNVGYCQILNTTGPQCFCPRTDKYLYIYDRCQGQVLQAALYGGTGAAVFVLIIGTVILGIFLHKAKH